MFQKMILSVLSTFLIILLSQDVAGQQIIPIMEQNMTSPAPNITVTVLKLIFPPGDAGAPPHYHSGPVVGYIVEGDFLFQMKGGPMQVIKAGGTFFEKDRDIHVWGANASNNTVCKVVVTLYGRPGEPVLTFVDGYKRQSYEEALVSVEIKEKEYSLL